MEHEEIIEQMKKQSPESLQIEELQGYIDFFYSEGFAELLSEVVYNHYPAIQPWNGDPFTIQEAAHRGRSELEKAEATARDIIETFTAYLA